MPCSWKLASKTDGQDPIRSGRSHLIEVQAIAPALLADSLRVLARVARTEAASASIAVAARQANSLLLVLSVGAAGHGPVEDCGEGRGGEDNLHFRGEEEALPEERSRAGEDVAEDV